MTYTHVVIPGSQKPTHHMTLTDSDGLTLGLIARDPRNNVDVHAIGRNPVQTNTLKTMQGNMQYSDLQLPYMAIQQEDWSGGRGLANHDTDTTRYLDGTRMNTERSGRMILGGKFQRGSGFHYQDYHYATTGQVMVGLYGDDYKLARSFESVTTGARKHIAIWLTRVGDPAGDVTVTLHADSGGSPGSVLGTATFALTDKLVSDWVSRYLSYSTTSGTTYWIVVTASDSDDADNHYKIGMEPGTPAGTSLRWDGEAWVAYTDNDLIFRFFGDPLYAGHEDGIFFQYKRALYFVTKPDPGTASRLYINGYAGACTSNAGGLSKLNAGGSPGWSTDSFAGCVALLVEGPGSEEDVPYREIVSNDGDSLTVTPDWKRAHTTATSFVILGSEDWRGISGHGLTAPVTDVVVTNQNVIYFCQGADAYIRRARFYNNSGTWTNEFAADGTNYALYMAMYLYSNANYLLRVVAPATVSKATAPAWGADLSFGSGITVEDGYSRVTGIQRHLSPSDVESVYLFHERGLSYFQPGSTDTVLPVRLDELKQISSMQFGKHAARQESYLLFTAGNSLFRYAFPNIDNIGPTTDEGLPDGRRGPISAMLSYPDRIIIAIDGGEDGVSSVLSNNGGSAWHELYRAPEATETSVQYFRIWAMDYQIIPGDQPDRLWVRVGADMIWLPFPSDEFDPYRDENYPYAHEGVVELSRIYSGLQDAYKFWKSLKVAVENLSDGHRWVEVDYRLDGESEWTTLPDIFDDEPTDEVLFNATYGVNTKGIDLRIRMYSDDTYESPKLTAIVLNGVVVTDPKFAYTLSLSIDGSDLNGDIELEGSGDTRLETWEKVRQLDDWCGEARPLLMRCINPLYDNRPVFLMPAPVRPLSSAVRVEDDEGRHTYTCQVVVQEA